MSVETRRPHGRKTGRLPRGFDQSIPHYSAMRYAAVDLPPLPERKVWTDGMKQPVDLGLMRNGDSAAGPGLGLCGIAEPHHGRQIQTFAVSGVEMTDLDAWVVSDYTRLGPYVPGRPDTDEGVNLQEAIRAMVRLGITTGENRFEKPLGVMEIDPRNHDDVRRGILENGHLYTGAMITSAFSNGMPGQRISFDPTDTPQDGHCIGAIGFDPQTFWTQTWGFNLGLDPDAWDAMVDELYLVIWPDWFAQNGETLMGLTRDQLVAAMQPYRMA